MERTKALRAKTDLPEWAKEKMSKRLISLSLYNVAFGVGMVYSAINSLESIFK